MKTMQGRKKRIENNKIEENGVISLTRLSTSKNVKMVTFINYKTCMINVSNSIYNFLYTRFVKKKYNKS